MNLRYAFQDDENCFFVLDLMLGGDLRCESLLHSLTANCGASWRLSPVDQVGVSRRVLITINSVHLERLGSLSEEVVRFYVAELSTAIAFLHDKKIIHRYVFFILLALTLAPTPKRS